MEREVIPRAGGYPGGTLLVIHHRGEERRLLLLPYVKGLVSERERVRTLLNIASPEVILLHISPEELEGLRMLSKGHRKPGVDALSTADSVYLTVLEAYGEVELPSPSLTEALDYGAREGIPVKGVDMGEVEFTDLYLRHISYLTRLRRDRALKGTLRKHLPAGRPEEALMILDREVMKLKGYRTVERERTRWQARSVLKEALGRRSVAYIQEVERAEESLEEVMGLAGRKGLEVEVSRFPEKADEE